MKNEEVPVSCPDICMQFEVFHSMLGQSYYIFVPEQCRAVSVETKKVVFKCCIHISCRSPWHTVSELTSISIKVSCKFELSSLEGEKSL